jgi:hypothetical protein
MSVGADDARLEYRSTRQGNGAILPGGHSAILEEPPCLMIDSGKYEFENQISNP